MKIRINPLIKNRWCEMIFKSLVMMCTYVCTLRPFTSFSKSETRAWLFEMEIILFFPRSYFVKYSRVGGNYRINLFAKIDGWIIHNAWPIGDLFFAIATGGSQEDRRSLYEKMTARWSRSQFLIFALLRSRDL